MTDRTAEISASVDAAVDTAVAELDADKAKLESAREAVEGAAPFIGRGSLTELAEGINALIGLASGLILGALIMYYLLKDGSQIRRTLVAKFGGTTRDEIDGFIGDACAILREYGRGRSIMSGLVAVSPASSRCCSVSLSSSRSRWSPSSAVTSRTSVRSSPERWP